MQDIDAAVDWNLEMGAIIRRSHDLRAPAPLVNRITGIPAGFRALGAPGGVSADRPRRSAHIALALGLDPGAGGGEIVEALAAAVGRPPVPPRVIGRDASPCQENILLGDDVDLPVSPHRSFTKATEAATSRPTA